MTKDFFRGYRDIVDEAMRMQESDVNDQDHTLEYDGQIYDVRHGSAFDRGSADCYYRRPFRPHYFEGGTYMSKEVLADQMTPKQLADYRAGFDYQRALGDFKDWGEG